MHALHARTVVEIAIQKYCIFRYVFKIGKKREFAGNKQFYCVFKRESPMYTVNDVRRF